MKKTISILFIISIFSNYLLADMAPVLFIPGGNVAPTQNYDIQMQSEIITITLYHDYFLVNVSYNFVNFGETQKVAMGFPSTKSTDRMAKNFKAFENGKELYVYQQDGDWEFNVNSKYYYVSAWDSKIDSFDCFNVDFEEGETKTIINTYKSKYQRYRQKNDIGYNLQIFYYILQTGSLWKGSIDSIRIIINSDNIKHNDLNLKDSYFQDKPISLQNFDTTLNNIEPNFDLYFITKGKPRMIPINASSELYSQGEFNFKIENLVDYDKKTAWIEGKSGYGINEHIKFQPNNVMNKWGNTFMTQIDSLSIINGYAYDENVFIENSRVKKIMLSYKRITPKGNLRPIEFTLDFEDTQDMQTFIFDPPLIIHNGITMTILETYKGSKYADTAISEANFHIQDANKDKYK